MSKYFCLAAFALQVVAIKTAKSLGYYIALWNYLTDNPGQYVADKFYLVSITIDKEAAVLEVREKNSVMVSLDMHQILLHQQLHMWLKKWVYPVIRIIQLKSCAIR